MTAVRVAEVVVNPGDAVSVEWTRTDRGIQSDYYYAPREDGIEITALCMGFPLVGEFPWKLSLYIGEFNWMTLATAALRHGRWNTRFYVPPRQSFWFRQVYIEDLYPAGLTQTSLVFDTKKWNGRS